MGSAELITIGCASDRSTTVSDMTDPLTADLNVIGPAESDIGNGTGTDSDTGIDWVS